MLKNIRECWSHTASEKKLDGLQIQLLLLISGLLFHVSSLVLHTGFILMHEALWLQYDRHCLKFMAEEKKMDLF